MSFLCPSRQAYLLGIAVCFSISTQASAETSMPEGTPIPSTAARVRNLDAI